MDTDTAPAIDPAVTELMREKKSIEAELGEIKHRMNACGRLPDIEWRNVSARRAGLVKRMAAIDNALSEFKNQRRAEGMHAFKVRGYVREQDVVHKGRHEQFLGRITALRDRYGDAAKNPTHTAAARFLYQRFAEDLQRAMTAP